MSRVWTVGMDQGTFAIGGSWGQAGNLPILAGLMAEGAWHVLEPLLVPEHPIVQAPCASAGSHRCGDGARALSAEETAQVEDRLRALGYLG